MICYLLRGAPVLACAWCAAACLGPQVDDTLAPSGAILPPGTEVPTVYEDSALAERIALADGVDGVIPLLSGFAGGQPVEYWDFGPAPEVSAPLFYLMDPATGAPIDHPGIVATLPGDAGYSPYWSVFMVPITDAYQGEVIPSLAALEEAQRLGLVGAPEATGRFGNCPVVALDVALELSDGSTLPPSGWGFVEGRRVAWYNLVALLGGEMLEHEPDGVTVPAADLYRLRREGGEPLSEPVRLVDMTGDGDIRDSNDILAPSGREVQRRVVVSVVVPAATSSIDDAGDQTVAQFQDASDLFDIVDGERVPRTGNVVAFQVTEGSRNLVVRPPGVL